MDRREFLRLSLGAVALTIPPRAGAASHPDLLSLLGPDRVREIGEQYRRLVPAENDPIRLRAAVLAGGRRAPSIAAKVRDDFDAGCIVVVNGWVLAATEARQCALFSLLA